MTITERVDYLQRRLPVAPDVGGGHTTGEPGSRRLLWVRGVGRVDAAARQRRPATPVEAWRPLTTGLITGLYGYRIPLAFFLRGGPNGIRVQFGTWSTRATAPTQDRRRDVIRSVLSSLYASSTVDEGVDEPLRWPLGGVALGIPAPSGTTDEDGAEPIDRIVRALTGTSWAVLVLAFPVAEQTIASVRHQILNESRAVQTQAATEGVSNPLAEHYVELLRLSLASLGEAMATGAWRTAVYLLGDGDGYPRLATAWRSVFSGERSLPEPIRVFDLPAAVSLAHRWALPDLTGRTGPGHYQRPFELQTVLTTAQLAAYAHLPALETPGFAVERVANFDSVRPPLNVAPTAALGRILHRRRDTAGEYRTALSALTRHVFVAGVTGSGKTNTVVALLAEVAAAGVPFLVIEPAKKEYRTLIHHPALSDRVRIFTAGQAGVAPLLLNPFEVPAGTTVGEHVDLIRAAFAAAFGMWTPLPQILERCLHEVYADRGWDMTTNTNARLAPGDNPDDAFPTLADLITKAREVIPTLGYDDRIAGDLRAALTTRLEALRTGGKGAMLDVARSIPIAELLAHPTVIELESVGDEGDKAFLAALILIRLAEHRRAVGQHDRLVHLLVVEEAHRLLANVPVHAAQETANPRGQAVEVFSNLLSEIRAYGQGVVVADQVPVRLAPDVIKNTGLKVAHRTVSSDDREVLAGAMAMDDAQARALTTLGTGEAVMFSDGDDSPVLVRVPLVKRSGEPAARVTDEVVTGHMATWRHSDAARLLLLPRPFCAETCGGAPSACEAARRLMTDEYVQRTVGRIVLSTIEESGALDRLWEDLITAVSARRRAGLVDIDLLRAVAGHAADWYANRRGAQGNWSYRDTGALADRLRAVLLDKVAGGGLAAADLRASFQNEARLLHRRAFAPYPVCDHVCHQDPPLCLYRAAVADLVASRRYQAPWRQADTADAVSAEGRRQQTWEVCQDAAYELVEFPDELASDEVNTRVGDTARRVCLCFEQQMLAHDERKVPRTARRILARVLTEAGL